MLTPISGSSADLYQHDRWVFDMFVGDDDGYGVEVDPVITVSLPDGSTSSPTLIEYLGYGYYRAAVTVAQAGWYTATAVAAGYGSTAFSAWVVAVSASSAFPTLDQVKAYLGTTSTTDATILDALNAEAAAQRKTCAVGPTYGADLAQALKRRVARNLAMRGIPMAVLRGDSESGPLVLPGRDPEVRRLEGPYRRLVQP